MRDAQRHAAMSADPRLRALPRDGGERTLGDLEDFLRALRGRGLPRDSRRPPCKPRLDARLPRDADALPEGRGALLPFQGAPGARAGAGVAHRAEDPVRRSAASPSENRDPASGRDLRGSHEPRAILARRDAGSRGTLRALRSPGRGRLRGGLPASSEPEARARSRLSKSSTRGHSRSRISPRDSTGGSRRRVSRPSLDRQDLRLRPGGGHLLVHDAARRAGRR